MADRPNVTPVFVRAFERDAYNEINDDFDNAPSNKSWGPTIDPRSLPAGESADRASQTEGVEQALVVATAQLSASYEGIVSWLFFSNSSNVCDAAADSSRLDKIADLTASKR